MWRSARLKQKLSLSTERRIFSTTIFLQSPTIISRSLSCGLRGSWSAISLWYVIIFPRGLWLSTTWLRWLISMFSPAGIRRCTSPCSSWSHCWPSAFGTIPEGDGGCLCHASSWRGGCGSVDVSLLWLSFGHCAVNYHRTLVIEDTSFAAFPCQNSACVPASLLASSI
jgi:hypothetical protein